MKNEQNISSTRHLHSPDINVIEKNANVSWSRAAKVMTSDVNRVQKVRN